MTEREAEVSLVIHRQTRVFPSLGPSLFCIMVFLSAQPKVGNVNQQNAASDLQGGIWVQFFESGRTPTSPAGRRCFGAFRG